MKDKDFLELIELKTNLNGFIPANSKANDLLLTTKPYETLVFQLVNNRDVKFHRAYFGLINYIYSNLPINFQKKISNKQFYNFLKLLTGQAKTVIEFKDLPPLIEFESISFGNMNQKKFEDFIREQLSTIYTELLPRLNSEHIIELVEEEWEKLINVLTI